MAPLLVDLRSRPRLCGSGLKVARITVSASFRLLVARLYPGLAKNSAYWRFFGYLLFGTFFDQDTRRLIIDQGLLAECEQKPLTHYCGVDFLMSFQREVMSPETFQWTGHREGKCRQVSLCIWRPEMELALQEELQKLHHAQGRVYFDDGRLYSRAKQRAARREQKCEAVAQSSGAPPEVSEVLNYMNSLPSHLFTKKLTNLEQAVAVANLIQDPMVRDTQLRLLATIKDQPQPFYARSRNGRTDRIFGQGQNLTALKRDVRRAMCRGGWCEADLTNCQLAIVAKEWEVLPLLSFLRENQSIWDYLTICIGNPPVARAKLKDAFKEPLYALLYGMSFPCVQGLLTHNLNKLGIESGGTRIFESPLIQALKVARASAADRIRKEGGGATCFGVFLPLCEGMDEYQVLALQAQAMEMKLLHPVIALAKETEDFTVTLWQHDGFSVHFTRRQECWTEKINQAVQEKVNSMGIPTRLEWKHSEEGRDNKEGINPHPTPREGGSSIFNHLSPPLRRETGESDFPKVAKAA